MRPTIQADLLHAVQWPREGALAARSQLQAQAQAERAAEAAAAAAAAAQQQAEAAQERARPPSARLAQRATAADADVMAPVKADPAQAQSLQAPEGAHRSSVADFSHLSAPVSKEVQPQQGLTELPGASAAAAAPAAAAAQASSAAAAAPERAQSPRRSLRSPQSFRAAEASPAPEAQQDGAWAGIPHGLFLHCHWHTDTSQYAATGVGVLLTLTDSSNSPVLRLVPEDGQGLASTGQLAFQCNASQLARGMCRQAAAGCAECAVKAGGGQHS